MGVVVVNIVSVLVVEYVFDWGVVVISKTVVYETVSTSNIFFAIFILLKPITIYN